MGNMMQEPMYSPKDEEEIKAIIAHEIRQAWSYDRTELQGKRTKQLEYFQGVIRDLPSMPGRSAVVAKTTSDVIGWMLPGIIRTFMASGTICEFEPQSQEDEPFAQQASDYLHHLFVRRNDGYRVMYEATFDSLLHGDAVVKAYWQAKEEYEVAQYTGLDEQQIAMLMQDGDVEITGQEIAEETTDPNTGQPVALYNVSIRRKKPMGKVCIEVLRPEDFYMDPRAQHIDDARFTAHRDEVRRSDLLEMGFDPEKVRGLPRYSSRAWGEETDARERERFDADDSVDEATDIIEVWECYAKFDINGDGVTENIRVVYAGGADGGEILDIGEWADDVPFTAIPCSPMPHRWESVSIADDTMDLQKIATALNRQLMDNTYASNHPMREVEEGSVLNPDALVNPKFGGVIWKKRGSLPIAPHAVPFVADKTLSVLQHVDAIIEKRTGISRATMALDPEALSNQTATAVQKQQDAAYSKIELVARNMAELGWKPFFRKLLKLVVRYQDRGEVIRLRNEWVTFDPRHWNADMDVTINVGLGTGSRDRDMAMLNEVLRLQNAFTQEMRVANPPKAIEMLPKAIDTAIKIAEAAGLKNADDYFVEFNPEELQQMAEQAMQPPPEDPKIALEREKAQIGMQVKQAELQMDGQKMAMQAQADQQKAAADMELARVKMQAEMDLKREQIGAEMALKREQLAAELVLKREQMQAEMALKREVGLTGAINGGMTTSRVHVGGEPG